MMLVSLPAQEEQKLMKYDMVTYSKRPRQRMRKIWTLSVQFFVKEHILTRKKKIAVIVWAHTMGQGGEMGWLLEMRKRKWKRESEKWKRKRKWNIESESGNLEIQSVTNRKPMQISKNRRKCGKTRFCGYIRPEQVYFEHAIGEPD